VYVIDYVNIVTIVTNKENTYCRGRRVRDRMVVRIPFMARCTRYNIM